VADTKKSPRSLALVVLAAGKGKRLKSETPKVLHPICGRPALWHVLRAGLGAKPSKVIVVVGHGADDVRSAVASWEITPRPVFVEQTRQLGTGHAVRVAERAVGRVRDVLVMGGDYDPVTGDDVKRLIASHRRSNASATIASTVLDDPGGYGRVVRVRTRLIEIVEDVDATPEVRAIREVSIVLFAFQRRALFDALPELDRRNRQREYYLNRVIPAMLAEGMKVNAVTVDTGGAMGVNSRSGLAAVEAVVRARINARHMANGVTLVDPGATYVDVDVEIGPDSVIHPNTFLERGSRVGSACAIGPSVAMSGSEVGDGSVVRFSVLERARVGRGCEVGPFARLRDGAVLDDGAQVGNYVEVKASTLGRGAKAKHLAYLGEHRSGHRHGQLRRVRQARHQGGGRGPDRFGYDAGGAGDGRARREHGSRIGDHEKRSRRRARGRTGRAAHGRGLPGPQGRGASPQPASGRGPRKRNVGGAQPWRSSPRSG
jgi:bifunctional UDP-N-acetylglucosamine pyrophosphorylase / glucosamine-1-phosphate N-acetyltransferase